MQLSSSNLTFVSAPKNFQVSKTLYQDQFEQDFRHKDKDWQK
jgi:hypothetical protein